MGATISMIWAVFDPGSQVVLWRRTPLSNHNRTKQGPASEDVSKFPPIDPGIQTQEHHEQEQDRTL